MLIEELLRASADRDPAVHADIDPLRDSDALQESQLLDVRFDAVSSTIGILLELRTALQMIEGNTAVLVARGVREFAWSAGSRSTDRTAWNVVGSESRIVGQLITLEFDFVPNAGTRLVAETAAFYAGDVASLAEQLPDYQMDDDATIQANLASWRSSFSLRWATFLDGTASM